MSTPPDTPIGRPRDGRSAATPRRPAWPEPALFLLGLLILRVVFLLGAFDPSQERVITALAEGENVAAHTIGLGWAQGPERPLYDTEELYCGTAAQAIRMRLGLPLAASRFMPYGGGSLLMALLAVPLYELFGPHYFAFKILAVLVTLVGGLFWFLSVRLWLGRRAGRWFALLFAFAPPVLVRTALIAKGDHPEAMAILGAILYLASRAYLARGSPAASRWAGGAGLLAGLGVWVTYSTLPVLVGTGIAALVLSRVRPLRLWFSFAGGLLLGLVPWALWVLATPDAVAVYGDRFGSFRGFSEAMARLRLLFARGLMAAYDLPGLPLRRAAGLLWLALVAAGWVSLVRHVRRPFAALTLGGTILALAAFCLAAPDPSSRYLLPVYPLFLVAVIWVTLRPRAAAPTDYPRVRALAVSGVILVGLISQVTAVADSRFPALRTPLRGVDWQLFGETAGMKLSSGAIAALPPAVRSDFWAGAGRRAVLFLEPERWPRVADVAGPDAAAGLWRGIGIGVLERLLFGDAPRYLRDLPEPARLHMRAGLVRDAQVFFVPMVLGAEPSVLAGFLAMFARQDRPAMRRALATSLAMLVTHGSAGEKWSVGVTGTLLADSEMAYGAGWALYRDAGRGEGPRFWTAPAGSWPAAYAEAAKRGEGPRSFWEGVAAAYEWELRLRSPSWFFGGPNRPHVLTAELERICSRLAEQDASFFYEAAARAAAVASRLPSAPDRARQDWDWRGAIPPRHQPAFARGLWQVSAPTAVAP